MPLHTKEILEMVGATALVAAAGEALLAYASGWPTSQLFGRTLTAPRNSTNGPGQIALTFDDGPNPLWTPQLLEILARHNIRATFFLIAQYAAAQRSLVRQTLEAGHLIGNHTWNHPNLARTNSGHTREQLSRTSA